METNGHLYYATSQFVTVWAMLKHSSIAMYRALGHMCGGCGHMCGGCGHMYIDGIFKSLK